MKRIAIVVLVLLTGCQTQEDRDRLAVNQQQKQYGVGQPVPQFDWSLERDLVIQLYQARNRNVATHSVWRSDLGKVVGDCPSIGYPIPYDTSLTNPLKRATGTNGAVAIEQPEPNGIFASKNSIATWVMCAVQTSDGSVKAPVYVEDRVTVYPYPVDVNYETDRVMQTAGSKPTVTFRSSQ